MALFPNVEGQYSFKGKTHTNLVVSEGAAPSEKLIVSKAEAIKFSYAFGPEGNQNVVLAKGKVVEAAAPEYDYETARNITTLKQAGAGSRKVIGVNHHNIYERKRDRFSGNAPTVITRSYIELPLFEHAVEATAQGYASAMNYGAAYGVTNALVPGDFVKVGADGNLTKLDAATGNAFEIVGQVWAIERELPPAGFLQYYLDMEITELEAFLKAVSHAPSPGANAGIKPNGSADAGAYPYGYPYQLHGWKGDFEKLLNPTINKGIPFLTDGYFKAKQLVTNVAMNDIYDATTNNAGHIENVVFSGKVTFGTTAAATPFGFTNAAAGVVGTGAKTDAQTRNNALFIKLREKTAELDKSKVQDLKVKYEALEGGVLVAKQFAAADVHIDYTHNTIVVYLEPGVTYNNIKLDLPMIVDPVAGVPTEWDYAGSVGAIRVLLQR